MGVKFLSQEPQNHFHASDTFLFAFPQGGPSHLGDSVAPETVGHMTMRLFTAAKSGADDILQVRILARGV